MARPSTQQQRRLEVIEAALAAAAEHGLRDLSLTDVAKQAGVTRGALLYYYEGLTLKEIGDHLGHRSTAATMTYTKIDLAALRQVGDLDLGYLQ